MSQAFFAALQSGVLFVMIGLFGSLVETVGKVAQAPRVESFGRAIEAAAVDLPKIYSGIKNVYQGKRL